MSTGEFTRQDPVFAGDDLYDPYEKPEDPFGRPPRTEDRIPRDANKWPRILPLGEKMPETAAGRDRALRSFMRPSGAGDPLENKFMIERWKRRKVAEGMAMSSTLQLEWASTDPDDLETLNYLADKCMKLAQADEKSRIGTALHAITERHDMGLPQKFVPDDFVRDLPAWIKATKDFEILDIECFVVNDLYRAAGTFDRLVYYWQPCPMCGKHNRILDLKTGESEMGKAGMAMQLAIYAHSAYYDPETGARTPLPDVCLCRGIIVRLPQGSGTATLRWVNIAQAWDEGMDVLTRLKAYQAHKNWVADFETLPDFTPEIVACNTAEEMNDVYRRNRALWLPQHEAAGKARLQQIKDLQEGI